jgi:hypothetical protein
VNGLPSALLRSTCDGVGAAALECELALQLAVAGEPLRIEGTGLLGRDHRAPRLPFVVAVGEATPGCQLRDVRERGVDPSALTRQTETPQPRRVDEHAAAGDHYELTARRGVAAAMVTLTNGRGRQLVRAHEGIGER